MNPLRMHEISVFQTNQSLVLNFIFFYLGAGVFSKIQIEYMVKHFMDDFVDNLSKLFGRVSKTISGKRFQDICEDNSVIFVNNCATYVTEFQTSQSLGLNFIFFI